MNRRTFLATGVGALATPWLARAQGTWPSRPVTIIVPFTPGSSSDIIARAMAQQMQQAQGRPFTVENRPGATGEVGARFVIRSAPDGYTLMHAPISTWAINVALRPNLAYDPVAQLTRITQTVRTPNVLVVNPQLPVADLAGLIDWMKRNAATASYPSSGVGASDHLTGEMFKLATGTEMAHVPYSGGGPAMTSVIAGTTQISFQNLGAVIPHIQDGRLRPILITAAERSPVLPNLPTAVELGLRDFVVYSWQGFGGPAGMAPALLSQVHEAAVAALRSPAVAPRLTEMGFDVVASSPQEFASFQEAEIERWRHVVKAGRITAE
ncbi:tripartite tricarboxylate transporter substrate binding protein [Roseomonas sp. SSH11]|uniref:Tripartite tricarboxylate transporter substrate binding protein n=1 Tax=Pararoseomonas baculiformis TaxID=2820812 RepID=A0ABS4ADE7_9PROT|nr:tripartite tricarboxylate transporter substrate binding protein [Pararoseomonas baculiformis]MBP0445040.1 tripartite tricarboxylate transporter substrate binding protein [Pararoseomonas baculiformis]